MKVSSTRSGGVSRTSGKSTGRTSQSTRKSGEKVESADSVIGGMSGDAVEVSDNVTTIEIIRELVNATPDIRADQVERISKKFKEGKYKIDYEKVAEAFIKDVIANEIAKKPRKR
jgi:flagellar biosynthesis anti-sigma factor FlgM